MTREIVLRFGLIFSLIAIFLLSIFRIFFGVDFTDESFYLAVGHAFNLGNIPFVDEFYIQQTAALYLAPFQKVYLTLNGSTSGIVLFFRFILLLNNFLIAIFFYWHLKSIKPTEDQPDDKISALLTALPIFVFAPYSIYQLSYNTLSLQFIFLFTVLFQKFLISQDRKFLFTGAVCLGIAMGTYPPIAPIAGIICVILLLKRTSLLNVIIFSGCVALGLIPIFISTIDAGFQSLLNAISFHVSYGAQAGGTSKIMDLLPRPINFILHLGITLITFKIFKKKPTLASGWLILLIIGIPISKWGSSDSHWILNSYAILLAPIWFSFKKSIWTDGTLRPTLMFLAIFAILISWTSNNGTLAATGAAVIFICFSLKLFKDNGFKIPAAVLGVGISLIVILMQYRVVYRDDNLSSLSELITEGPFKGLKTSLKKRQLNDQIISDLKKISSDKTILFYDNFPAGYLYSDRKPFGYAIWMPPYQIKKENRGRFLRYYLERNNTPDVIFEFKKIIFTSSQFYDVRIEDTDPLKNHFRKAGYSVLSENENYTMSIKN